MSAAEHRCPRCDVVVVDTHECTEAWEEPDYGIKGFETTRCEVVDGVMSVSISGGNDMSGAAAVMALGDEAANAWFSGLDDDEGR